MTTTTFTSGTVIAADWLNDVDEKIYQGVVPTGGTVRQTLEAKAAEDISVKAFGAVGDGVTDDTTALQAALDYIVVAKKDLYIPSGTYKITSTLTILDKSSFGIIGESDASQTAAVIFTWDGANSGTALSILRVREASFKNIQIKAGTGTLAVGIELDQTGAGTTTSTNILFENIYVREAVIGMYVSRVATTNNDLHKLRRCGFYSCSTAGLYINNDQSKFNLVDNCEFAFCGSGIKVSRGSFSSYTCNFSNNTIDIEVTDYFSDQVTIVHPQSETAGRFLDVNTTSSIANPVVVIGGRLETDSVHADNEYIRFKKSSPLVFIGTSFSGGVYRASVRCAVGVNATVPTLVTFVNCVFPSSAFITGTATYFISRTLNCSAYNVSAEPIPYEPSIKGTTANRPTLSAYEKGYLYLDTTLDGDGKPVWWNGTGWVDATGAVV